MPFIPVSSSDVTDVDNRQTSRPAINVFNRPNPNNQTKTVLESFMGLTRLHKVEGKSRGANRTKRKIARIIGNKLYIESTKLDEQVTIPNSDRVKMSVDEKNITVVTGGKSLNWNGSELLEFKNWSKGEQNAPLDGTAFDISGITDIAKHLTFYVYIFDGRAGFGKSSPFRSDRPDAANFIIGSAAEAETDTAIGITTLDDNVLLMSEQTCRFYRFINGEYQENTPSRVEFSATGREAYCSWNPESVAIIGAPTSESTTEQNGVYLLGAGAAVPIHTQYVLDEISKQKIQEDIVLQKYSHAGLKFLILHLDHATLFYNDLDKTWGKLESGTKGEKYQAIDCIFNEDLQNLTIAAKDDGRVFLMDTATSLQDGKAARHIIPLPTIYKPPQAQNMRITLFELVSQNTNPQTVERMRIKTCSDGFTFKEGKWIEYQEPFSLIKNMRIRNFGTVNTSQGLSIELEIQPIDVLNMTGFYYEQR